MASDGGETTSFARSSGRQRRMLPQVPRWSPGFVLRFYGGCGAMAVVRAE